MVLRSWWLQSGRSIPQAHQNHTHQNAYQAEANPPLLERPETTPLTGAEDVHGNNAQDAEDAEGSDEDTKLAFGDHNAGGSNSLNKVDGVRDSADYSIRVRRCNFELGYA